MATGEQSLAGPRNHCIAQWRDSFNIAVFRTRARPETGKKGFMKTVPVLLGIAAMTACSDSTSPGSSSQLFERTE